MHFEFCSFNKAIIKEEACNQASSSTQTRKKGSFNSGPIGASRREHEIKCTRHLLGKIAL